MRGDLISLRACLGFPLAVEGMFATVNHLLLSELPGFVLPRGRRHRQHGL